MFLGVMQEREPAQAEEKGGGRKGKCSQEIVRVTVFEPHMKDPLISGPDHR